MGLCSSCFKAGADDAGVVVTPDAEVRRRLQIEAAEKRRQENERRGVKDPEKIKRQQRQQAEMEQRERDQALSGSPVLKWQTG